MFSHIVIGADDIAQAKTFYDATLGALGIAPGHIDERGRVIYQHDGGRFIVTKPIDGAPASHANGGTIGFHAPSTEAADAWHAAGVANGGKSIEDGATPRFTPIPIPCPCSRPAITRPGKAA